MDPLVVAATAAAAAFRVQPRVIHMRIEAEQRKLNKRLLFLEATRRDAPGVAPLRLVAKSYPNPGKGRRAHAILTRLIASGFGPRSSDRVVRALAWHEPSRFLLMEHAPGESLQTRLYDRGEIAAVDHAARWLARLHTTPRLLVPGDPPAFHSDGLERFVPELTVALPALSPRIRQAASLLAKLPTPTPGGPRLLHGDLHPANLFITDQGEAIGIDPDHAGAGDPARDVAYLASQFQVAEIARGHPAGNASKHTARLLRAYAAAGGPPLAPDALAHHAARALLESLHYETCVLHVTRPGMPEAFLDAVEAHLSKPEEAVPAAAP